MRKCSNCRTKASEGEKYCRECGTSLMEGKVKEEKPKEETKKGQKSQAKPKNQKQKSSAQPLSKKQKTLIMSIIGVFAIIFLGYSFGKYTYSKDKQVDVILNSLANRDANRLSKVASTSDPNFDLDKENIENFTTYLDDNPSYLNEMLQDLDRYGEFGAFQIRQRGKKLGLFDGYELVVSPIYGKISVNLENTIVSMDGEELFTSTEESQFEEVGPFMPGEYVFKAESFMHDFSLEAETTVSWLVPDSYNEADLYLDGQTLSVHSDLNNAEVFLNDKNIGQLEDGYGSFGPFQLNEKMKLHVEKSFEDGDEIVSDKVEVTEDQNYYDFDDLVIATSSDISSTISNLYSTANRLTGYYDTEEYLTDFNEAFDSDGPAYDGERADLEKIVKKAFEDEDVNSINFYTSVDEYEQIGAKEFKIVYELEMYTSYTYTSDKENEEKTTMKEATILFEENEEDEYNSPIGRIYEIKDVE